MQELYHRLLSDLWKVGIKDDFILELRPYSKTYFGRYDPNLNKVILYVYEDKSCTKLIKYEDLLLTLIHESIHSMQWHDKSFVRRKGVMHDAEFYRLLSKYENKAKSILLMREVRNDKFHDTLSRGFAQVCCRPYM